MWKSIKQTRFLFEELVKRDFKKKYKRTVLGMLWSILSPLFMILIMYLVFHRFFESGTPHYVVYLFAGQLMFNYFTEATNGGMAALVNNSEIISKINVPKYLFVLSQNVKAFINVLITAVVFFLLVFMDGVVLKPAVLMFWYPVICITVFNIGVGFILSALYVMFMDTFYLYGIFTQIVMFCSAIFYTVNPDLGRMHQLLLCNPVYVYITYVRTIIIDGRMPSLLLHGLALGYALLVLGIGILVYKKNEYRFVYYL